MFRRFSTWLVLLAMVMMAFLCGGCANSNPDNKNAEESKPAVEQPQETLLVYSGAGLKKPMDEIGTLFEDKYNVKIEYSYAGSAQNLSQIELSGKGDAWAPGDISYAKTAQEKDLLTSMKNIVYHIPVIAVPEGNPAGIKSLQDLGKPGVKVVLGDEKACAIGQVCVKLFAGNNLTDAVKSNTVATTATVNELLVYLTMKQADATIVWEDNVYGAEDVEAVSIPEQQNKIKTVPICTLKSSQDPEMAQQFADFVAGPEGKAVFTKYGFKTID